MRRPGSSKDKPSRTIEAKRLVRFADVIGDRHLVAATVGPNLDPVVLSLEQEPDYRIEAPPDRPSFSKKRADRPNRFRIHRWIGEEVWMALDLPETIENYHAVQPLGDEEWLLVRGRADGENDENAHVYDSSGRHVRSFHVGDGVQDVQATPGGDIWVGYFDEGVFGDTRLGKAGLARLDESGDCSFEFNSLAGASMPGIADCYALNVVSNREVWLCYYTDFPLVRLVDGRVTGLWLGGPVEGSSGFGVRGELILFAGGYNDRDRLILARIGEGRGVKLTVADEHGEPLSGFSAFGRRDKLFLGTKEALHVVDVPDRFPGGPSSPDSARGSGRIS